ncbi:MAG: hypothetical protein E6G97_18225 [Alphaproteobacteria bacterium]|nr:MAG: hypothetical protein E6G97_18225 [Alphaproteobacteria bacterium]
MNCRVRLTDVQGDRAGFADLIGKEGALTTVAEGVYLSLDGVIGSMTLPARSIEKDDEKIVVKTRRDNTFVFAVGKGLLAAAQADKAHKEEHKDKAAPAMPEEKKPHHEEIRPSEPEKKDVPESITQPIVELPPPEEKKAQPEESKPAQAPKKDASTPPATGKHERKGK